MSVLTPGDVLSESTSVPSIGYRRWRFENVWMVGALFVFSMCATFVFISTTGPARLTIGIAALAAPWVSHRVLARQP